MQCQERAQREEQRGRLGQDHDERVAGRKCVEQQERDPGHPQAECLDDGPSGPEEQEQEAADQRHAEERVVDGQPSGPSHPLSEERVARVEPDVAAGHDGAQVLVLQRALGTLRVPAQSDAHVVGGVPTCDHQSVPVRRAMLGRNVEAWRFARQRIEWEAITALGHRGEGSEVDHEHERGNQKAKRNRLNDSPPVRNPEHPGVITPTPAQGLTRRRAPSKRSPVKGHRRLAAHTNFSRLAATTLIRSSNRPCRKREMFVSP